MYSQLGPHMESPAPLEGSRPYRSHKIPACERCRKRKARCTIDLPDQPCLLCRLQGGTCSRSKGASSCLCLRLRETIAFYAVGQVADSYTGASFETPRSKRQRLSSAQNEALSGEKEHSSQSIAGGTTYPTNAAPRIRKAPEDGGSPNACMIVG